MPFLEYCSLSETPELFVIPGLGHMSICVERKAYSMALPHSAFVQNVSLFPASGSDWSDFKNCSEMGVSSSRFSDQTCDETDEFKQLCLIPGLCSTQLLNLLFHHVLHQWRRSLHHRPFRKAEVVRFDLQRIF